MLLPLLLLSYTLKSKIRTWGKRVSNADESIIRTINHSLGGIKETKVIGCFSFFEKELSYHAQEYVNAGTLLYSTQILPRILVECLLIFFLVGSTSILILVGNSIDNFIPVLSIFALSSIRLLPAISNSAKAVNKLRSMSHVVERLNYDIKSIENLKASEKLINRSFQGKGKSHFNNQTIGDRSNNEQGYIILQGITYQYPGTTSASICDISLSIDQGRSIALIGQSGAGKTTLVDTILGLLIPQSGDIKINNYSIYEDLRAWQNKIGYIPQSIFLTADTIERNIAFGVPDHLIDQQRLTKAIEAAQLKEVVENLPEGIQTPVGERGVRLSGGQRQRIGIARALYHEREILVLDEATSALDNETESLVTESIQSLSGTKTMIVIAHRLSTIKHCDRIYVMDKGKIIKSGTYQEVV
jgi:ABC-type multidrug transport system fused ATPase/permease subunit